MDLTALIARCAPGIGGSTIHAIIRHESHYRPHAIGVNSRYRLKFQPKDKEEAVRWARWLIQHGYSIDMGLMQINSANLQRLGVSVAQVFDDCENLSAGARILTDNYQRAKARYGESQQTWLAALSAYNTGNFYRGFQNGYVANIIKATQEPLPDGLVLVPKQAAPAAVDSTPNRLGDKKRRAQKIRQSPGTDDSNPYTAPTAVKEFTREPLYQDLSTPTAD